MEDLKQQIQTLKNRFIQDLEKVNSNEELEKIRLDYLSRKGDIASLMSVIKDLSHEDKRIFGPLLNELKNDSEKLFNEKKAQIDRIELNKKESQKTYFDITAYKPDRLHGSLHPYTHII